MQRVRLSSCTDPRLHRALELYRRCFPYHEQRETGAQEVILRDPTYHFDLLTEDGAELGALLWWEAPEFRYIEHLFIAPEQRERGYGSAALQQLLRHGKPVILEIDPPEDEISRRRLRFYEHCGMQLNPYDHRQPAYHRVTGGEPLLLLSHPQVLSPEQYDCFRRFLAERVLFHL